MNLAVCVLILVVGVMCACSRLRVAVVVVWVVVAAVVVLNVLLVGGGVGACAANTKYKPAGGAWSSEMGALSTDQNWPGFFSSW